MIMIITLYAYYCHYLFVRTRRHDWRRKWLTILARLTLFFLPLQTKTRLQDNRTFQTCNIFRSFPPVLIRLNQPRSSFRVEAVVYARRRPLFATDAFCARYCVQREKTGKNRFFIRYLQSVRFARPQRSIAVALPLQFFTLTHGRDNCVSVTELSIARGSGRKLDSRNGQILVGDFYSVNRSQLSQSSSDTAECPDECVFGRGNKDITSRQRVFVRSPFSYTTAETIPPYNPALVEREVREYWFRRSLLLLLSSSLLISRREV